MSAHEQIGDPENITGVLESVSDGPAALAREVERLVRNDITERPTVKLPEALQTGAASEYLHVYVKRPGDTLVVEDMEKYLDRPVRPRGHYTVYDVDSFVTLLKRYGTEDTTLWAQQPSTGAKVPSITAVINDGQDNIIVGWRDHRARLEVRPDPDWTAWALRDTGHPDPAIARGAWLSQQEFANFLHDQTPNLDPAVASEAYSAAQGFAQHVNIEVISVVDLDNDLQQFTYNETLQNGSERPGAIEMPRELYVNLRPFYGADVVQLRVNIRNRLGQSRRPEFGLVRHRPDLVEEKAWQAWCAQVAEQLEQFPLLQGPPPAEVV